ncbi:MAG: SDR family NAD(P)-dependent oxidoreductase, partial [Pseudonocardiales bacterium]|nr:SDR family NAD(P)-dependent oxidoreductase [Pseudonocardiales bacterium]MBV9029735.1 SDR family NAD(P)-dependent oxidoreductase [Pseudonocardiales bacterium]MBW0009872.1 SDR family NAD(P)-dependent oxidoreductase [Pseudonocardiales bacterium]
MTTEWKALVTGGSSGIGAAIAEGLAAAGCRLVVLGRDSARLDALARRTGARALVADLSCAEGLSRAAEAAAGVDLLVNSAGRGWAGDLAAMAQADIDALVALNLLAPLRLARAALPGMRERGRGHLVFVSSIAAVGVGGEAVYAATKAGLRAFAASVRHEVAGEGIGVTTLLPGAVRTPFFDHRGLAYDRRFPRQVDPTKVASALLQALARGEAEVFVPRWLTAAARVQGAAPELFHRLARRFG